MVQLIVVVASVLLGMILYPILLRKWRRFVEWLYWSSKGETDEDIKVEKPDKPAPLKEAIPSIVGKSKFNLRQSTPNTATDLKRENPIEKESTFAPSTDSDPEKLDISEPLEKVEKLPEEEFDSEEEEIGLEAEQEAMLASGVIYEELFKTQQTIETPHATPQEEKDAGKVIYQQEGTNIFEQVAASSEENALRISDLIDIHLKELALKETEKEAPEGRSKQEESPDFKNFDIDSIF